MRRTLVLLSAALLTSLVLNAVLWMQQSQEADPATEEAEDGALRVAELHVEDVCVECRGALARCREASWTGVVRTLGWDGGATEEHEPSQPVAEAGDAGADVALQEEMLCTIAVQHLRFEWESQRDTTIANLARSLADDEQREGMLERDLTRYASVLDLDEAAAHELESVYRPLWEERVDRIRAGLDAEPPDTEGVFGLARSLFADEDALVEDRYGSDMLRRFRLSQAEKRTAVLALLATHAGVPWDASITW